MITIYSEIFKLENDIIIIEIFRDKKEEKFIKIYRLENMNKNQKEDFLLTEMNPEYQEKNQIRILFESINNNFVLNLKKELTLSLEKLNKGSYIINLLKNNNKYKIINLKIY